jgi:hypothetical protein
MRTLKFTFMFLFMLLAIGSCSLSMVSLVAMP